MAVVEIPGPECSEASAPPTRPALLCAYVDLSLGDLLERFADPSIDGLLASAIHSALGGRPDQHVSAHASAPYRVSARNARIPVAWYATDGRGREREGAVTVSLLGVQSGDDPVTELLVTVPVRDASAGEVTAAVHRVLDELADLLAA